MKFQTIVWNGQDTKEEGVPDEYMISVYGRTMEHKSVICNTTFTPYFFIEVPEDWKKMNVDDLLKFLQTKLNFPVKGVEEEEEEITWKKLSEHLLLKKSGIVKRKKFYGFTNNEEFKFVRLVFKTKWAYTRILNLLKKPINFTMVGKSIEKKFVNRIYEGNIDPLLRFMHVNEFKSTGWINCEKYKKEKLKETSCDIEIACDVENMKVCDDEQISPLRIVSFDIETYSSSGSFPNANELECPIIQIASTFQKCGESKPYKKHLVNLGSCDEIEDVEVETAKTEKELIRKFVNVIKREDPDVIIGYNIWKFDLNYIHIRSKMFNIEEELILGRILDEKSEIYDASFSSSAYGDNDYKMVKSTGRLQIDLLELIKREHKLTKYSLNAVSEHFLKEKKVDLPYQEMFKKFKGTSEDRKEIGIYCVQDTILPLNLMSKLNVLPNLIEMAKATWVPITYLLERGQQIKVFSQILYQTRKENMLVKTMYEKNENNGFVGATVLNAKKGAYMDKVVTGLDFASLYPTIMRAHNLCYNTIVCDSKYADIPGITYENIEWEIDGLKKKCKFVQNYQGVLPKLLENLALNRKIAKKDMINAEKNGDFFMKSVYNGKQLAFKVSMNSIYGFCAAQMLPCPDISASVTTIGRNMIEKTKMLVEEWYPGSEVIYGDTDSVMTIFHTGDLKGDDALRESFRLGKEAADKISNTFKRPIELEFEKCYYPYLLFSKKRYAGLMYTNPESPDYIDAKGIQLVRRDNCELVREVSQKVLNKIMYDKDVKGAIDIVKDTATDLLKGDIAVDSLVVSKSLRKSYASQKMKYKLKNGEIVDEKYLKDNNIKIKDIKEKIEGKDPNLPHFTVAEKIEQRIPGTKPKCGERVPYVFIETYNPKDQQFKKAEDPEYVKQNSLRIDVKYYLEHALTNPMQSLFELFMENPKKELFESVLKNPDVIKALNDPIIQKERKQKEREIAKEFNQKTGQREISSFFTTKTKNENAFF